QIVEHCQRDGLTFKIVPDLYQMSLGQVDLNTVVGIPLIGVREVRIQGWNRIVKRGLDILLSSALLLLFALPAALLALAIKLDSPGPIIYRQRRVGRGGVPFEAYKFRSMREGADRELEQLRALNEADGPLFKMRRDPRVTRVGRLLRRASLDELPQLLNVLQGQMSLVGPRPPIPAEVEQYEPWHMKRLEVSPGLTGLWQVSGRSDLSFDEMVLLDIYYIETWSLGLDLRILFRTLPAVLFARGAFCRRVSAPRSPPSRRASRTAPPLPLCLGPADANCAGPRLPEPVWRRRARARRAARALPDRPDLHLDLRSAHHARDLPRDVDPPVVHAAPSGSHPPSPAVPASLSARVRGVRPRRVRRRTQQLVRVLQGGHHRATHAPGVLLPHPHALGLGVSRLRRARAARACRPRRASPA